MQKQVGADGPQESHFYTLTVMYPVCNGPFGITTQQGTLTPMPGATRFDLFRELSRQLVEEFPEAACGNVISFDIQPNEL
jgi:hypothetical protein